MGLDAIAKSLILFAGLAGALGVVAGLECLQAIAEDEFYRRRTFTTRRELVRKLRAWEHELHYEHQGNVGAAQDLLEDA